MRPPVLRVLRSRFDNSLSRRGALAGWSIAAILVIIVVGTLLLRALGPAAAGAAPVETLPAWVQTLLTSASRSLGIAAPATLLAWLLNLWFWFIGLLVMGTIFAWRSNALNRTTARVMAGRTPLLDRGHTVILGWSPIVPVLVRELALSVAKGSGRTVVLLSGRDRRESLAAVEDVLERQGLERRLRLVTRAGDPWNPTDLARVNCAAAATVIIVDDTAKGEFSSMTLAMAVSRQRSDVERHVIVQVRNAEMKAIVDRAAGPGHTAVTSEDIISKALAQSSRQPGVTQALFELLDFAGVELHTQHVPSAEGLTYAEVGRRMRGGTLVGLVGADGAIRVNPPAATEVGAADRCLVVKAEADRMALLDDAARVPARTVRGVTLGDEPEPHVAIVGPAAAALRVAGNLRAFLSEDAEVTILSRDEVEVPAPAPGTARMVAMRVDDYFDGLAGPLRTIDLDQLVVLADPSLGSTAAEVDAGTSVIVTSARQALGGRGRDVRFVAQVLDPASQAVVPIDARDDLIVSEEASAMMMVQAATDPAVFRVLVDLLDPSVGAAIRLFALPTREVADGPLRFRDLVALGHGLDASVFGWRYLGTDGRWTVDLEVDPDAEVPDAAGFGVLAIAGSVG